MGCWLGVGHVVDCGVYCSHFVSSNRQGKLCSKVPGIMIIQVRQAGMDALTIHNHSMHICFMFFAFGLMLSAVRMIWPQPMSQLLSVLTFEISKSLLITVAFIALLAVLSASFTAAQLAAQEANEVRPFKIPLDGSVVRPFKRQRFKRLVKRKLAWLLQRLLKYIEQQDKVINIPLVSTAPLQHTRPLYSHLKVWVIRDEFNMPSDHIGPIVVCVVPTSCPYAGQERSLKKLAAQALNEKELQDGSVVTPFKRPSFKRLVKRKLAWLLQRLLKYIEQQDKVINIPLVSTAPLQHPRPLYSHLMVRVIMDEFNMPSDHIGSIDVCAVPLSGPYAGQQLCLKKEWYWRRHRDQSVELVPMLNFLHSTNMSWVQWQQGMDQFPGISED